MVRLALCTLALLLHFSGPVTVRADHFTIKLHVHAARESKPVETVHPLTDQKPGSRAILMACVDIPITVQWTLGNADGSATVKDVLVHFFVVKQDRPDQQEVPKLARNVLVESALKMDFKPQDRTDGEITFMVPNPGCYLIRLELKGAAGKDEREPFTAIDLLIR